MRALSQKSETAMDEAVQGHFGESALCEWCTDDYPVVLDHLY